MATPVGVGAQSARTERGVRVRVRRAVVKRVNFILVDCLVGWVVCCDVDELGLI
jgi:hypothetical protein